MYLGITIDFRFQNGGCMLRNKGLNVKRHIIFLIFLSQFVFVSAQNGPGGVGNTSGTLNQPANVIWFASDSLSLSDNDPVETLVDISGNNNNATQTTSDSRPIYRTAQLNGKPAIVFDGSDDYMPFDGNLIANSDYTVIFVGKRRSDASLRAFLGGTTESGNRNLHLYWHNSSQFRAHHYGNDLQTDMVNTSESYSAGTDTDEYGAFATLLASSESSEQRRNYQNNHFLGSLSDAAQLTDYLGAALGKYKTVHHDVNAAEVIIYSSALNDAQLQIVYQYLNIKYDINIDNDLFNPNASYIHNTVGVGTSDGTQKHTQTPGSGGGILLAENNNSFDEADEYVFAAHDNTAPGEVATLLPSIATGSLEGRSDRIWYVERTDATTTDISIGFNLSETGLAAGADNQIFYLLHRSGTSGDFSAVTGGTAILSDGEVLFNIEDANFADGYYTVARSDQTGRTWYSYASGDWDNWQHWSLEAGGSDIVNPDELTPSISPTASIDKVVILHPYEITVNSNDKSNAILEVRDGTINFQNTTGHYFNSIEGQGTIQLSSDNFPGGNDADFSGAGGGTVEFIGTGHDLVTSHTFNNVSVNLTNTTDSVTLLADYSLNGDLTISNGILGINDDHSIEILNLDIAGNVSVETNGKILVGEGNTIGSYSIPGTMPALGQYHSIYHQVSIGGDLTNEGYVRFTNLAGPDYAQFADNGAATVTFYGASNNTAYLNGTTGFYNLIIDKGVDQTYMLEIDSEHDDYFQLYGPNNVGRRTGGTYTDENPEVRKALWIKNGTLKLSGYISIPSLSEGNQAGGNGDYPIPGNGCLWIGGTAIEGVKVFSTAISGSAELLPGTSGVTDGSSNQALSVYGKFKITNGTFNTRNSAGFIFWSDASAVVEIAGGLCDVAQFRSAHGGAGGKTSFIMSDGELMVRGNEQFTYDLDAGIGYNVNPDGGGEITGQYPAFGIIDPDGVFQMSGGKIYIADNSGNNDYNSNALCINAKIVNHSATGGDIFFLMENNQNYDIISQGNLYDLELINRDSGAGNGSVYMGSDLDVNGNLVINDYTQLVSRREYGSYNGESYDLEVDRNFTISSDGDYRAINNTTTLLVTYSSSISMSNTDQEFFNLVIKNNPDLPSTVKNLSGNNNTIMIHNDLKIEPGATFNFSNGNKDILVKDDIVNSGTITTDDLADIGAVVLSNRGVVTVVSVTGGGSYDYIPTITIDAPTSGTQATAVPVFNGVPSAENELPLAGILITDAGSGYSSAPSVTISGTGGASANAVISLQHSISGDGNGVFANLELDESMSDPAEIIAFLLTDITVSNTMTLTNGILDLKANKLRIDGTLADEDYSNYGNDKMFRTNGNFSDGGIERKITANQLYLFPFGTAAPSSYSGDENRYTPYRGTFYDVDNDDDGYGYIQANPVGQECPTLNPGAANERALQYYWRLRNSDFSPLPEVNNQFNYDERDVRTPPNENSYRIGKVVNYVRTELGKVDNTSTNLMDYVQTTLEEGDFTAGHQNRFTGSVEVYYSYHEGGNRIDWNNSSNWTTIPHGAGQIDDGVGTYPEAGDIAIIGYNTSNTRHQVELDNHNAVCGKLVFEKSPTGSVPHLFIYQNVENVYFGTVEGYSNIYIDIDGVDDCDFQDSDFGDWIANSTNRWQYTLENGNHTLPSYPFEFPTLRIAGQYYNGNGSLGSFPRTAKFTNDITCASMFVDSRALLYLNDGADGDITCNGLFRVGWNNPGKVVFPQSNSRTITADSILIRSIDGSNRENDNEFIIDNNSTVEHNIFVSGDFVIETNDVSTGTPTIDFYADAGGGGVILNIQGGKDNEYYNDFASSTTPEFYRIELNKPEENIFSMNNDFTLEGETSGSEKAIELQSGTLKINDADIDITLSSGGSDFQINSSSCLWVNKGTARVTDPGSGGIFLDGYLRVAADGDDQGKVILDGGVGSDNYILYSSSGNAKIRVAKGYLEVGSQIRSSTLNNLGVIHYAQTGNSAASGASEVIVGKRSAPEGTRGIFEVMNSNSWFQIYNGTLYIARAHDDPASATRAPLYLDPGTTGLNEWGNIQIGLPGTTPAGSTIKVNATPDLCHFWVDGASAQLDVNPLSLVGQLDIVAGATFDGNGLNLTLKEDIRNRGTVDLNVDTLIFEGDEQEIYGDITVENMNVKPTTSVILDGTTNIVTVNNDLYINQGQLSDNEHTILVKGNLYNDATHISTGTGRVKLAGSSLQKITGEGQFGNLEIDNEAGARLQNNISTTDNLYITNGILDIQDYNLELGVNSSIVGSGFDNTKMIATNGSFADKGLTKNIPSGIFNFTFPVGIISGVVKKYTPVEFDITANSTQGSIQVHPVNQKHMTVDTDVLQYFWTVEGESLTGFEADMKLHYLDTDVVGTESNYISAWLYNDSWSKFPVESVDETEDTIRFSFPGVDNISGDFTAGIDAHIPDEIPVFETTGSGDWTDVSIWNSPEGEDVPSGGPNGQIVKVMDGHTVNLDRFRVLSYRTEIYGRLEVGTELGHNLGHVSGSGTLAFVDSKWPVGEYDDFMAAGTGSTIEYGGGSYDIPEKNGNLYNNMIIKGTGTKTFPKEFVKIRNDLNISETVTLKTQYYFYIYQDLNLDNNAVIDPKHYILFIGENLQEITGDFTGPSSFNYLWIKNKSEEGVVLNGNSTVKYNLLLNDGILKINEGYSLVAYSGIYSGSEPYLDQSWIEGNLTIRIDDGTSSSGTQNLFPIAKNGKKRFVRLDNVNLQGTAAKDFTVEYFDSNPHDAGLDTAAQADPVKKVSGAEYWMVDVASPAEASVSIDWGAESGVDPDYLASTIMVEWDGTQWNSKGGTAAGDAISGTIDETVLSSFSTKYFTLGADDEANPLPIELILLTVEMDGDNASVQWKTASEINNDFFTVERSDNGVLFTELGNVNGAGNSNQTMSYELVDKEPLNGISYYRIKQTDFDGNYEYSDIAILNNSNINKEDISIYPNPIKNDQVNILLSGLENEKIVNVYILSTYGEIMYNKTIEIGNRKIVRAVFNDLDKLKPGLYILSFRYNNKLMNKKIIVN